MISFDAPFPFGGGVLILLDLLLDFGFGCNWSCRIRVLPAASWAAEGAGISS
jgi:hypothetical protein